MKLSIQNIIDWLAEHDYVVHFSVCTSRADLTGCRWLYSDSFEHGILYIEPAENFSPWRDTLVTIVTYGNDILRVEAADTMELFNTITSAFHYFADWERRLLECILLKKSLQDLIDIGDEVFQAPMIVDGIDGQSYGLTRRYPPEIHETWRMRLENDEESYDFVKRNAHRDFFKRLVDSFYPEFNKSEVWPGNTLHSNLFYNGRRVGFIVLYEYKHIMRPGDSRYLYVFARIVEQHIAQYPEKYCYTTYLEFFLYSVLFGGLDNWDKLQPVFRHNGWRYHDEYCVYCLLRHEPTAHDSESSEPLEQLSSDLRIFCPDAVCIAYDGMTIILVNLRNGDASKYADRILRQAFYTGRSMTFQDISSVGSFFQQAADAAVMARERGTPFLKAENLISARVVRELQASEYARSYIPQPLLRLAEYDRQNKTELLAMSYTLTLCNLNITDAAFTLGLHRNTILQKEKRISTIMGTSLQELIKTHGYCSVLAFCSMLLYEASE